MGVQHGSACSAGELASNSGPARGAILDGAVDVELHVGLEVFPRGCRAVPGRGDVRLAACRLGRDGPEQAESLEEAAA
eukprot:12205086-Alexandrium_andersonii.AAC.1